MPKKKVSPSPTEVAPRKRRAASSREVGVGVATEAPVGVQLIKVPKNSPGTLGGSKILIVSVKKVFLPLQGKEFNQVSLADGSVQVLSDADYAAQLNQK